MSRIACVAKQFDKGDVNGTLISNCAFQQWANHFGQEADQVGFTGWGRPGTNWINPGEGKLKAFRREDYFSVLNRYDAIYFSTPGIRPSSRKPPILFEFQRLEKPFIVAVHGEEDFAAYESHLSAMASHPKCRGIVVVGIEAVDMIALPTRKIHWYPCTLNPYLLQEDTKWQANPQGLLYAGRVINWRLLPTLAEMTRSDEFMTEVQGEVEIKGLAAGIGGHKLEEKLAAMQPRWNRVKGPFDVLNVPQTKAMYADRRFFWDVCRTDPRERYHRRMNLVAVEAMGQGCIPIVSPAFAPEWSHQFSILFDHRSETGQDLIPRMRAVNESYDLRRDRMKEIVLNSHWSYDSVKVQFQKLLEALLN